MRRLRRGSMVSSALVFVSAIFTLASCASFGPQICHDNFKSLHRKNIGSPSMMKAIGLGATGIVLRSFRHCPMGTLNTSLKV